MNTTNHSLATLTGLCLATSVFGADKPNVLIIMTDEHSFRTLGCYRELLSEESAFVWGDGVAVETPNIDKLSDRGMLFANYYASNPVSGPSRSSFMTGMYPHTSGVYINNKSMKDEMVTFAESLYQEGYATGYMGKWHLDGDSKPGWAPERKFGFQDNKYMFNRGHWKKLGDDKVGDPVVLDANAAGEILKKQWDTTDEKSFTTDFLTDKAIAFMTKNKNDSFCCMLSIPDPHGPNIVREPYSTMYKDMEFQKPVSANLDRSSMPTWATKYTKSTIIEQKEISQYFGMVKCIDDNVGKILSFLKSNKLDKNTIIIFTADHGDMLGEHNRDNKSVPYEASAKIPMIWVYPGEIEAGTVQYKAMNNTDFTPTLLGVLGVEPDMEYQGKNHMSSLIGDNVIYNEEAITVFRSLYWIAATNGKLKLVYSTKEDDKPVLFDLAKDPLELKCVYDNADYQESIIELAKAIKTHCIATKETIGKSAKLKQELNRDSSK